MGCSGSIAWNPVWQIEQGQRHPSTGSWAMCSESTPNQSTAVADCACHNPTSLVDPPGGPGPVFQVSSALTCNVQARDPRNTCHSAKNADSGNHGSGGTVVLNLCLQKRLQRHHRRVFTQMTWRQNFDAMPGTDWVIIILVIVSH